MATKTLMDLIREASEGDRAALREALAAPAPAAAPRAVLDEGALRELRARAEAARRRVTQERPTLGRALQAAEAARDKAQAEMARVRASIETLDNEVGAELDNVRREAFAGRPVFVAEAADELRREAAELHPDLAAGGPRHPFPGSPREEFSNRESCDRRRGALLALAERLEGRAAEAAFITSAELREWLDVERKALPALEPAEAVRRRVEADRARRSAA